MREKIYKFVKGMADEKGIIINENTDLFECGVLDSLGIVQFLVFLNEEAGVNLNFETMDSEKFRTFSDISDYLLV